MLSLSLSGDVTHDTFWVFTVNNITIMTCLDSCLPLTEGMLCKYIAFVSHVRLGKNPEKTFVKGRAVQKKQHEPSVYQIWQLCQLSEAANLNVNKTLL